MITFATRRPHAALVPLLLVTSLGGCGLYHPLNKEDREAVADCTQDADRQFEARNRYQLSERDGSDSPFSANTLAVNPNAHLSDQYDEQQLVDKCLARGSAGPDVVPGSQPGKP